MILYDFLRHTLRKKKSKNESCTPNELEYFFYTYKRFFTSFLIITSQNQQARITSMQKISFGITSLKFIQHGATLGVLQDRYFQSFNLHDRGTF